MSKWSDSYWDNRIINGRRQKPFKPVSGNLTLVSPFQSEEELMAHLDGDMNELQEGSSTPYFREALTSVMRKASRLILF